MNRGIGSSAVITASLLLAGCTNVLHSPPTTQHATTIDDQQADPAYWLAQPAQAAVAANDFDRLWSAADLTSRDLLFHIDRRDRRNGVMTTEPSVSPQFFEPWRRELQDTKDVERSSVATIRRTIYYTFKQAESGYIVTPKVLVERQAIAEKRVSGMLSRAYFRTERNGPSGTRELDEGVALPNSYWYAIGRDEQLEAKVAQLIRDKLQG